MSVSFSSQLCVSEDVMVRELGGESVLLNLKNEMYYGLDDVGTTCWTHLTEAPTIAQACDRVSQHFGIDRQRAQTDMLDLVTNLLEQGLVEVRDGADTA